MVNWLHHPNVTYFIILLCLMPNDFTHWRESAGTQWVKVYLQLYIVQTSIFILNAILTLMLTLRVMRLFG
jgi:hypothetical protein